MKTEITEKVVTHTEEIKFGYWDENADKFIEVRTTDEIVLAAQKLDSSPALIEALVIFADLARDMIGGDLADIWKRLDAIEARLDSKAAIS